MAVYCHSEMLFSVFSGQHVHIVFFQLVALLENKKLFSAKKMMFIRHSAQRLSRQHMYLFLVQCQKL